MIENQQELALMPDPVVQSIFPCPLPSQPQFSGWTRRPRITQCVRAGEACAQGMLRTLMHTHMCMHTCAHLTRLQGGLDPGVWSFLRWALLPSPAVSLASLGLPLPAGCPGPARTPPVRLTG